MSESDKKGQASPAYHDHSLSELQHNLIVLAARFYNESLEALDRERDLAVKPVVEGLMQVYGPGTFFTVDNAVVWRTPVSGGEG